MPSTVSLIQRLKTDYPAFSFKEADDYLWSPADKTVSYVKQSKDYSFLLHELSHGILHHSEYDRDIELIAIERAAWDKATEIALLYGMTIDDELVESTLDSYRDWLHARSTCPNCEATGLQTKKYIYACLACGNNWQVNEARMCALRRTKITT